MTIRWVVLTLLMVCAPLTARATTGQSAQMARALQLYQGKDYYQASALFYSVVEGQTGDDGPTRHRAEIWLGRSLHQIGLYAAALAFLDRATRNPTHTRWLPALKWVVVLAGKLPETSSVFKRIGAQVPALLGQPELRPIRDGLRFYIGRALYQAGDHKKAAALLGAVDVKSPLHARARLLEGFCHVRRSQHHAALRAFRAVLDLAAKGRLSGADLRRADQALISVARLFYTARRYALAVKYYGRVPATSSFRADALYEESWAHYQLGAHDRALAALRLARRAGRDPFLESYPLEALIYNESCRYRRAQELARAFARRYEPLRLQLAGLLGRHRDPADFHDFALEIRRGKAGLGGELDRLARNALADRYLERRLAQLEELAREEKLLRAAPASWKARPLAGVVLQDLTLQRSLYKNEAGQLAQRRIGRVALEIRELLAEAKNVEQEAARRLRAGRPPASCDRLGKIR